MENLSGAKNLSEKKARKNKQLVNSRPVGHVQNHNVGEIGDINCRNFSKTSKFKVRACFSRQKRFQWRQSWPRP